jgi:hypothetical protein
VYEEFIRAVYPKNRTPHYPFLSGKSTLAERQRLVSLECVGDELLLIGVNSAASINFDKDDRAVYVHPRAW